MALRKDIGRTDWNPAWRLYKFILDHEASPPHTSDLAQFMDMSRSEVLALLGFLQTNNLVKSDRTFRQPKLQALGLQDPADVGSRWSPLPISSDTPFPLQPSVRARLIADPPAEFKDEDDDHDVET